MKKINSTVIIFLVLIGISVGLYGLQLDLFHSPHDTYFYLLQDVAFLPMQVAIVTVVLQSMISTREKKERLKQLNMVISSFFGEVGTDIIVDLNEFNQDREGICEHLKIDGRWQKKDFAKAIAIVRAYDFPMDARVGDLTVLKRNLIEKHSFFHMMLQNQNLLEHETYSDMLWAVFHLMDEMIARDNLNNLPQADLQHLSLDIQRAYSTLLIEWVNYMEHLKTEYPYLFSLAVRKNPFDKNRSVVFQ
ncbi:MAG: hypothetical protein HY818_17795 [Acetobacterium woodii]|nr:hypothetical protein [Acetobacterium woodii]